MKKVPFETVAVFAAVVLFVLADVFLVFGFIGVFDSLDSSKHLGGPTMAEEVRHPSIGRAITPLHMGGVPAVDDKAVLELKQQLSKTQILLLGPGAD